MKYWDDDQIITRDVIEGEDFVDLANPSPALKGEKLLSDNTSYLYEFEAIPGSERTGTIVSPITFEELTGTVVDVIFRRWNDDKQCWDERKFETLVVALGFDQLPHSNKISVNPNFDRAMEIL